MTLYMKIGGRSAVVKALPLLKERLDADPCFDARPLPDEFHESSDLCEFLVFITGGAPFYDGKPVAELLSPICRCRQVYSRLVDHLVATLLTGCAGSCHEEHLRALMDRLHTMAFAAPAIAPVLVYSAESEQKRA